MGEIIVALISPVCEHGNADANVKSFDAWTRKAAENGARFVGFPEMAISGYAHEPKLLPFAETVPGPSVSKLENVASEYSVYLSVGLLERDGETYWNTQVLVGPDGYIGAYRKHFPTEDEQETLKTRPGKEYPVFTIDGIKFGMNICADSREIETISALADQGVELVHSPHANVVPSLGVDAESWTRGKLCYYVERSLRCRAHILLNNIAGTVTGLDGVEQTYASGCLILDPLGQVVARTTGNDTAEKMIVERIDTDIGNFVPSFEARKNYMQSVSRIRSVSNGEK
jgi:predicted amidohydrolase